MLLPPVLYTPSESTKPSRRRHHHNIVWIHQGYDMRCHVICVHIWWHSNALVSNCFSDTEYSSKPFYRFRIYNALNRRMAWEGCCVVGYLRRPRVSFRKSLIFKLNNFIYFKFNLMTLSNLF